MALSYSLRVACLIALSLGLIQIALELLLWLAAPAVHGLGRALAPRPRERLLYAVQLAPMLAALLLTASFFLPQYLLHETNLASEPVSRLCVALAVSLYAWWGFSLLRGAGVAVRTMRFSRACRRGSPQPSAGVTPMIAVPGSTSRVALVGLVRPFIFISESLLETGVLDPPALQVVLDHERSHAAHGDNWKLLSLYCLPRLNLRLSSGKTWMQRWQAAAECAADEDAVSGDAARAFLLAQTLVTLARLTRPRTGDALACTCLISHDAELSQRVERLLDGTAAKTALTRLDKIAAFAVFAGVSAMACLAALSSLLRNVPERLLHLG